MKTIIDFVIRHSIWIILGIIALLLLSNAFSLFQVIFNILLVAVASECVALGLSSVALFVYTKINFTALDYDKDGKYNSVETHAFARVIAAIFIGVHLLVAIIVLAMYQSSILNALNG